MVVYTVLLMVILVLYTNGWFFQYISNEGKVFHFVILILQKKLSNQLINLYDEVYEGNNITFLKNFHSFLIKFYTSTNGFLLIPIKRLDTLN